MQVSDEYRRKIVELDKDDLYCPSAIYEEDKILRIRREAWFLAVISTTPITVIGFLVRVDLPLLILFQVVFGVGIAYLLNKSADKIDPQTKTAKPRGYLIHNIIAKIESRPCVYSRKRTKKTDQHRAEPNVYRPFELRK